MALTEEVKYRLKNNLVFGDEDDGAVGAITILVKNEPSKEAAEELLLALENLIKEL